MNYSDKPKTHLHPRTIGWFGTTAVAMGGINQSLFLIGALIIGQGDIPGQGSAAVLLLALGLFLSWAATPGWLELVMMFPNRVGGISAACAEAFRPYSPLLSNLTGVCYWWGWVPTCGLTALLSASALHQWYLPWFSIPWLATCIVLAFTWINLCGVKWVMRVAMPLASASAFLAFLSALTPIFSGEFDWHQSLTFHLTVPFPGWFGEFTSVMAGLYLVGFAAPAYEQSTSHVGETIDPNRNVPRAVFTSAALAGVYFVVLPVVWLGTLGPEPLSRDLAQELGPTFAPLLGATAKAAAIWFMTFNMLHGTLAPLAGASRVLAQLAEDELLPESLALRNDNDAPWVATLLTAGTAIILLFIGDPIWLIAAANLTYLIGIAMPNVAVWLLRRNEPALIRPYRAPKGAIGLGLLAATGWLCSVVFGFQQFGLPTVMIGIAFAYSGSILYAWRKFVDRRRRGLPGVAHTLHVKLTGAMLLVLLLDAGGYLIAVQHVPNEHLALIALLEDIFVIVALLTIGVGLILPGMIAHSAVEVSKAAQTLVKGTLGEFNLAMQNLASGNLDQARTNLKINLVKVYSRDEVGDMAHSFNDLQVEVSKAAQGLDGAREGLLKARHELLRTNEQLQLELEARKEAEKSVSLLAAIVTSSSDAIIGKNLDGTVTSWNAGAERIFGYSSDEMIGTSIFRLVPPDRRQEEQAIIDRVRRGEKVVPFETLRVAKDGHSINVSVAVSPIKDQEGKIVGASKVARDITERKQQEEKIQATLNELRNREESLSRERDRAKTLAYEADAANRAKSEFLAMMSHEIRTPMNGILGMTELLLKSGLNSRQVEFAGAVSQSAQSLMHVIDDVLDFSKIEAGKLSIVREKFSIRAVLDSVLEVVSHRSAEKQLRLLCIVSHQVPLQLKSDPLRIRQILLNLISNAINFTQEGEVIIRVSLASAANGPIRLRIEVTDTGVGLSQEAMERLFKPFVQVDQSASRRFGGTGLGLAISSRLATLLHGEIGVQSTVGSGSTFWCELPCEAVETDPVHSAHPNLKKCHVIISVQNPQLEESLRELLLAWQISCDQLPQLNNLPDQLTNARTAGKNPVVLCDEELASAVTPPLTTLNGKQSSPPLVLLTNSDHAISADDKRHSHYLHLPLRHSQLFDLLVTLSDPGGEPSSLGTGQVRKATAPPMSRLSNGMAGLRILLAEDHKLNQKMALLMLEEMGLKADVAVTGVEVLSALARQSYDLILMDCSMPELDGYDTTRSIRQIERTRHLTKRVPIIALTANALMGERERCLAVGMDDYLAKPFTIDELRGTILRVVGSGMPGGDSPLYRLHDLARQLGQETMADMVKDYVQELPGRVEELKSLCQASSLTEAERLSHSLKSVSASFGLEKLADHFSQLENTLREGQITHIETQLSGLELVAKSAVHDLENWLSSYDPVL